MAFFFLVFFDIGLPCYGAPDPPPTPGHPDPTSTGRRQYVLAMSAPESTRIHGSVEPGFEAVRAAFENNFATQGDVGASVAITIGGRTVVDLWGGTATFDGPDDDEAGVPGVEGDWQEDTIINVWSTTKTMAALVCLMLADRGELDLYEPIATYWPEFAANGKEQIATRHVLSHTAGLSGWDEPLHVLDYLDHDKLVRLLAAQAPWWEPGTRSGYHAISQGYLLGEIVKRVDGRTLGTFFAEEVAGPLGADFHIGTPPDCDPRVARVIPPTSPLVGDPDPTSIPFRTFGNPVMTADVSWRKDWRRAEIPAAGGHGNARSVALCHTPTACGGTANGVTLLSPGGCRPHLRRADRGDGPESAPTTQARHGLRAARRDAARPEPAHVLLGWLGRLARDHRRRRPDELQLRDEPHG